MFVPSSRVGLARHSLCFCFCGFKPASLVCIGTFSNSELLKDSKKPTQQYEFRSTHCYAVLEMTDEQETSVICLCKLNI